jgi:hypothetical protein
MYITCIILKIEGLSHFVLIRYDGYKLKSKGTKGGMTLHHIGYVEVGSTLVLPSTISVTSCDQVV